MPETTSDTPASEIARRVRFRPARAQDVDAALPLIVSSGPDAFNYVFRTARHTPEDFLRAAFVDGAGEFGFRNHVVGEVDGRVLAAGGGWTSATTVPFLLAAVRQFITILGPAATPPVVLRGLRTEAVIRPPVKGEFYIGHVGVDHACRGQGIGAALVAHLLAMAQEAGARLAVLDVSLNNPRAAALYARLGFEVTAERSSNLHRDEGFVPAHRRMARAPE
jgi:ribosomal protein S18 acetylase RimI-like enzyme